MYEFSYRYIFECVSFGVCSVYSLGFRGQKPTGAPVPTNPSSLFPKQEGGRLDDTPITRKGDYLNNSMTNVHGRL